MTTAQRTALSATTLHCVLAFSGAARADWRIPRAKAVAADPCAGRVTVDVAPQAEADWLASTLPSQCRITLLDAERWPWSSLCPRRGLPYLRQAAAGSRRKGGTPRSR